MDGVLVGASVRPRVREFSRLPGECVALCRTCVAARPLRARIHSLASRLTGARLTLRERPPTIDANARANHLWRGALVGRAYPGRERWQRYGNRGAGVSAASAGDDGDARGGRRAPLSRRAGGAGYAQGGGQRAGCRHRHQCRLAGRLSLRRRARRRPLPALLRRQEPRGHGPQWQRALAQGRDHRALPRAGLHRDAALRHSQRHRARRGGWLGARRGALRQAGPGAGVAAGDRLRARRLPSRPGSAPRPHHHAVGSAHRAVLPRELSAQRHGSRRRQHRHLAVSGAHP